MLEQRTCPLCRDAFEAQRGHRRLFCYSCQPLPASVKTSCPLKPPGTVHGVRWRPVDPVMVAFPRSAGGQLWCLACGAVLDLGDGRGHAKKWCSKKCMARGQYYGLAAKSELGTRKSCARCGWSFVATAHAHLHCSKRCGQTRSAPPNSTLIEINTCVDCGELAVRARRCGTDFACLPCHKKRKRELWRQKNRQRRLAKKATTATRYTLAEVGDRDGWKCHICGKKVDASLSGMANAGPTVDHLVPISAGGSDDVWNVALAHRVCNLRRGAGGTVQLRLAA